MTNDPASIKCLYCTRYSIRYRIYGTFRSLIGLLMMSMMIFGRIWIGY